MVRAEGPGAGFQPSAVAGASEPCLPVPAAAAEQSRLEPGGFAPSAERRRPGRDRLRCAARRCSRQAPRPPEKAALGRAPAPSAAPAPGRARRTPPRGRDGSPGFLSCAGPAWGSLCVHLCPPTLRPRAVWASQPEAWQGLLPAAWLGNSRCCHGTRHLLRGVASRCTPRGAPHPLLHCPAGRA